MEKEDFSRKKMTALIKKLAGIRGRHTELVTIYVPAGYNLANVAEQVRQEQGTAANIKSKAVRKNVLGALEKINQHLKLYKQTPPNGLAIFCGNVSEKEGESDIELWAIEPPEPLNQRLYRCDQEFILDALNYMVREREIYGVLVLDKSEADIGLLKGKYIESLKHLESLVPGKTKKGGWCVHEDSLMQHPDGRIIKVKDLGENKFVSYDFDKLSAVDAKHNHYFKRTSDDALLIETKAPSITLNVTPEHNIFVPGSSGFSTKRADELSTGDCLLALKSIHVEGRTQRISAEASFVHRMKAGGREYLRRRRAALKLRQRDVARALGVSQTFISKFEVGERELAADKFRLMTASYKLNPASISRISEKKKHVEIPRTLNAQFARFIGYFIGDGSIERNRITLHEGDHDLARCYSEECGTIFGIKAPIKRRSGRNYMEVRIHSKALADVLMEEMPDAFTSGDRDIPESICKSPRGVIAAFIGGLWDAEGYVTGSNRSVGITMKEKDIISKLQLLLLRFGVISSMKTVRRGRSFAKRNRYTLVVTDGRSLSNFRRNIRLLSERKNKSLERIVGMTRHLTYTDQIPFAGSHVLRLVRKMGMTAEDFPKVQDFFFDKKSMSYEVFRRNVFSPVRKRLRELETGNIPSSDGGQFVKKGSEVLRLFNDMLKSDIISVRIKSVRRIPSEGKFYDMEVPKYSNFIANGIILHNSQARYARIREGILHDFLKKVGEIATDKYRDMEDLHGIIVGGPGPIKDMFMDGGFMGTNVKDKVIGVVDTSYTGKPGLDEAVTRADDLLADASITKEKKILTRFFSELGKDSGLAVYGVNEVLKAMGVGAVEVLLISEQFGFVKASLKCSCGNELDKAVRPGQDVKCPKCGSGMKIVSQQDMLDFLAEEAEKMSTKVEVVSADSREGLQFLEMGGIAGILRYSIE